MKTKQIYAVFAVAIIVIAGVAVYFIANNGGGDDKGEYVADVRIYGNANNDNYIDSKDIDFLNAIVYDNEEWDEEANPYADADNDGFITAADIEIVQKIINGQETIVYYTNYFDDVCTVHYPITGKLGVNFWQQAEIVTVLGKWSDVIAVDSSTLSRTYQYSDLGRMYNLGSRDALTTESVLSSNISALICHGNSSSTTERLVSQLKDAGSNIDIICLKWEGTEILSTVIMLGIFLQETERAYGFVDWSIGVLHSVQSKLSDLSDDEIANVIVPLMYESQHTREGITVECEGNGDWSFLSTIANVCTFSDSTYESKFRVTRDKEWFLKNQELYDYIYIIQSSIPYDYTTEKFNALFEQNANYFFGTEAYNEGRIGSTLYGFTAISGFAVLPLMAYMIYPDIFDFDDAMKTLQYYYDTYTEMDYDVSEMGYFYTGTEYPQYQTRIDSLSK